MWWLPHSCRQGMLRSGGRAIFTIRAAISGAKMPDDRVIDGKNLLPLMEGRKGAKSPHQAFFYGTEAVRSGKWKLKGRELFDLDKDIGETQNLAADNPEIVKRLLVVW